MPIDATQLPQTARAGHVAGEAAENGFAAGADRRRRWGRILSKVWGEIGRDHVSMMAAAVAFYGLLAIFPGMSALMSVYGLVADGAVIERHIDALYGILPVEAVNLLSSQLHALMAAPPAKLGVGFVISLLVALWSATSGTSVLMEALTVAYEEHERRSLLHFYGLALLLTLALGVFALAALFLIAGVPMVLDQRPLIEGWSNTIALLRWPIAAFAAVIGIGFLYRVAPCRKQPRWGLFNAGTLAASLLWVAGSAGFSFYVGELGSYDRTYGSVGAVVVLLMWLYLSAYIILAGAELNAALERPLRAKAENPPAQPRLAD